MRLTAVDRRSVDQQRRDASKPSVVHVRASSCVRRADVEAKRSLYDNLYHRYGLKRLLPKKLASKFAVHETEFHWRDAPIDFEVQNDADPELVAQKIYKRASEIASNPAI